jgi:hypothetical protein
MITRFSTHNRKLILYRTYFFVTSNKRYLYHLNISFLHPLIVDPITLISGSKIKLWIQIIGLNYNYSEISVRSITSFL